MSTVTGWDALDALRAGKVLKNLAFDNRLKFDAERKCIMLLDDGEVNIPTNWYQGSWCIDDFFDGDNAFEIEENIEFEVLP